MKTKHLLTALALPALFAACTADDIVTEGASQAQRVALNENFKLNFGGAESRLSAGKPGEALQYAFEEGDMVGGAIIDQFTPAAAEPTTQEEYEAQYSVVDFVSANQPFTFDGTKWTINHTMVEGKYLFYYPYNEANNSRGAAQYSIPVMQDLSDKVTGEFNPKAAVERYGMSVGYQFLSNEDLSASVELAPIFGYARLVLKLDNRYGGGEVEKIVLRANSYLDDKNNNGKQDSGEEEIQEYFNLSGQLSNAKIAKLFKDAETDEDFDWSDVLTTSAFALDENTDEKDKDGNPIKNSYYDGKKNTKSLVMVGKVPEGVSMATDAQGNKSFETYMVLPAQAFNAPITVYLYTADGRIYAANTSALTFKRNTPKKVELYMGEATTGEVIIIASQQNWNDAVNNMGKKRAEFIIADPNFTITNDTKFPTAEEAVITIKGDVTVSGDNVTMKNVVANTITVAEGAKLTTDVTVTAKKIVNKGTVVVAENPEKVESKAATEIEEYDIDAIENHATLTVNKGAVISFVLENKKSATLDNAGELTISGKNFGAINNAGTIYTMEAEDASETADFVNGVREHKKNAKGELEVVNEPTIKNAATGKFRADANFVNYSLFVNEGILSCKNNAGKITNGTNTLDKVVYIGVIDAKASSTTYITTNNGKVIVYDMKQTNVTTGGKVEYAAIGAAVVTDESIVTDIVANGNLEIKLTDEEKPGSFTNLIVKGTAVVKMTWPEDVDLPTLTSMTIEAGNTTLGSDFTVNKLTIEEGAVVNVPADYTLTVAEQTLEEGEELSSLLNEGTISVIGTFNALDYASGAEVAGDVEDNGKGTINWKPTKLDNLYDAYIAAYADAIVEWINWNQIADGDHVKKLDYDLKKGTSAATAKASFVNVYNVFAKDAYKTTWPKLDLLKTALANYNTEYTKNNANVAEAEKVTAKTVEFGYTDAVAKFVKNVKDTDAYKTFAKTFKVQDGTIDLFNVATVSGTTTTTAKTYALADFKTLVATDDQAGLTPVYKCVLNTETSYDNISTYIKDYRFAFVESNIYKIYANYIRKYNISVDGCDLTTNNGIKKLVETFANVKEENINKAGEKLLYKFISENDFAVYQESLNWNYNGNTILGIETYILQQAGN